MEKLKKCANCGQWFNYGRITAKYCSNACKQQYYLDHKEQQFLTILDAEDAEIESYPETPTNETTSVAPFEEIITEPEVINESEEAQTPDFKKSSLRSRRNKYLRKTPPKTDREKAGEVLLSLILANVGTNLLNNLLNSFEGNPKDKNPVQNPAQSQEPVSEEAITKMTKQDSTNNDSIAPQENSESIEENEHQPLVEGNNSGAIDDLTDTTTV